MANLIHKLSRNSNSLRVISTINAPVFSEPTTSLISHKIHLDTTKPYFTNNPIPFWGLSGENKANSSQSLQFVPNFPFGYCFAPVISTEYEKVGVSETQNVEPDDARTVWADSVKKKRKRKMNKHKYKKLRKRLRRKT
ncbi:hypothetical protein L6164_010996 [Bauhinia variegata]|uniref:Uncharacterized protein n=1 Tax=Bauhinia variegata TaxID=167791 RepID=A0ACB9P4G7_BAUVA|nr:hypothetical protein L6164_010996 [Bauhinia variegata]